jgi:hypothetical protein
MTDYRDPNYRDPNLRDPNGPGYRAPLVTPAESSWSMATWGWIAGIAVVALVLVFAFSTPGNQSATNSSNPPATTTGQGQRTLPEPPAAGPKTDAPTMTRPGPATPEEVAPDGR